MPSMKGYIKCLLKFRPSFLIQSCIEKNRGIVFIFRIRLKICLFAHQKNRFLDNLEPKMDYFVTLHLYCLICFVTCFALPTDINFSEQQADTAGNKIARNEDHRITDHGEGCPIRYETRFEIQEIENVRTDCREWTE